MSPTFALFLTGLLAGYTLAAVGERTVISPGTFIGAFLGAVAGLMIGGFISFINTYDVGGESNDSDHSDR